MTWRDRITGPMLLLGAVLIVEALGRTSWRLANPSPLLLLVVVYSAFIDPRWKAFCVAGAVMLYGLIYFSPPTSLMGLSAENLSRVVVLFLATPVMAWMTSALKERAVALEREAAARRSAEGERDFVRLVIAQAPLPFLVTQGPSHHLLLANNAAGELFGLPRESVEGRPLREASPRVGAALLAALDTAHRTGAGTTLRVVGLAPPGQPPRTVELSVVPLPDPRGGRAGLLVMAIDHTEQRKAEADLARVRADLTRAERLAAMGAMVSGLAHEIRTPLTYASNHLHLLRKRIASRPDETVHLQEALQGIERINDLVLDLRRYLKTDSGQPAPVQVEREVREALRLFEAAHRGRVSVERELRPCRPALAEPLHVQQIVLNLVENAAAVSPRLHVRVGETEQGVELCVRDEGPGMLPEVKARMFDPLFTTKADGTGLGLAIVRRLVESHGGAIDVDSEIGRGSTFRVVLPYAPRSVPIQEDAPTATEPRLAS